MRNFTSFIPRTGIVWYLLIVVILPLATLGIGGIVYFWQSGLFIFLLTAWAIVTALAYLIYIRRPTIIFVSLNKLTPDETLEHTDSEKLGKLPELGPKNDWSKMDLEVWESLKPTIDTQLAIHTEWQELPNVVLTILPEIAKSYHPNSRQSMLNFTLPEALLVLSVVSDRYRQVISQEIPYSEKITLAQLMFLYQNQPKLLKGFNYANNVRRFLRLSNPLSAAMGEMREQFTNRVFGNISTSVNTGLKRLLLQEITQVAIDLYSGRLKVSDEELASYSSDAIIQDQSRHALPVEPLRVLLVGQVSSGKSSLINGLANEFSTEVDQLPSTNKTTVHALSNSEGAVFHLIDTEGLTQKGIQVAEAARLASEADIILLVVKATQPARAADRLLLDNIEEIFSKNPARKMPPVALVVTHIDQLTPRSEWHPPYDLTASSAKTDNINSAICSIKKALNLSDSAPAVPVCLDVDKGTYNVDAVFVQMQALSGDAAQAQLNRRRVELIDKNPTWENRWLQLKGLGRLVGNIKKSD